MAKNEARSAPELLVTLDPAGGGLQRQIEDQLREAIRAGRLLGGARLPSSRALAGDLGVSRGIVSEAYGQLAAEGWVSSTPRAAPRVAHGAARTPSTPATRLAPRAPRLLYDARPGRPDLASFPRREWGRSVTAVLRGAPDDALGYPPTEGIEELRATLAAYRARVRAVSAQPEDVIVCGGVGQALMVIADALVARGVSRIIVEDPGHAEIRALLEQRGLQLLPVDVDGGGLDTARLPAAEAVLVTPAHQYPLGAVLAPERRAALLEWAQARDAIIIEDDYDAEFRYDRAPVGSLQGIRPDLVLHVGSVSKTLAPALRLGWIIAPPPWRESLLAAKTRLDHGLPGLDQLALAEFIQRGGFDRHIRRTGRRYRARRDALLAALAAELPTGRSAGAAAGLHTAVALGGVDEARLVRRCYELGLGIEGLRRHEIAHRDRDAVLLVSFASVPEEAAPVVARLIATAYADVAASS